MLKKHMFVFMILVFLISCRKSDDIDSSDLIIKTGFACGWGAGEDSLEISRSEIRYVYYVPSESSLPKKTGTRMTSETEWLEIKKALDINIFCKLEYNTCNICVDGCDEWIMVKNDKINHRIRFTKGEQIEEIGRLQEIISRIKSEFQ